MDYDPGYTLELYSVYRNGQFQLDCHAETEQSAIDTAIRRRGYSRDDLRDAEWVAEVTG